MPACLVGRCGDCRRATPVIERVAREMGCTVLRCGVGDRPAWKDAGHPLRNVPMSLQAVPSLVEWKWDVRDDGQVQGVPGASIGSELEDCSEVEVEALVRTFVQQLSPPEDKR